MPKALFHQSVSARIERYLHDPFHGLLLIGPDGIGKSFTARYIMAKILEIDGLALERYPYVMQFGSDENPITIEEIRTIGRFLSLRVPSSKTYNRLILLEHLDDSSLEAQNALLKFLEEPPSGTVYILTATDASRILPTVLSRLQQLRLTPPTEDQTTSFFIAAGYDESLILEKYLQSAGLLGIMTALLEEKDHPLLQATEVARELLTSDRYSKIILVDRLAKHPDLSRATITMLTTIADIQLRKAASAQALARWETILQATYAANDAYTKNGQSKLILTQLMLSI